MVDEVNANNQEVRAVSDLWLETLQEGIVKIRKMFGLTPEEFDVKRRNAGEVTEDDQQE